MSDTVLSSLQVPYLLLFKIIQRSRCHYYPCFRDEKTKRRLSNLSKVTWEVKPGFKFRPCGSRVHTCKLFCIWKTSMIYSRDSMWLLILIIFHSITKHVVLQVKIIIVHNNCIGIVLIGISTILLFYISDNTFSSRWVNVTVERCLDLKVLIFPLHMYLFLPWI